MLVATRAWLVVGVVPGLVFALAQAPAPASPDALLARLAIDLGAERDPAPISVDPDGSGAHGVVYDRFTRAHLTARQAFTAGKPLDPASPPRTLLAGPMIIVATPIECDGRTIRATDVDVFNNRITPVPKWLPATGAALAKFLPGARLAPGAIGVQFQDPALRAGQIVRITYASPPCGASSRQLSMTVTTSDPRIVERAVIEVGEGQTASSSVTLTISGVVDLDGHIRYASAPEASTPLGAAAMKAAGRMRFDPSRMNGSPVPWTAGVIVTFGVGRQR